jgi:glycosyltransferase involved in cell wall biosynthesis
LRLLIVIPVYNERRYVEGVLAKVLGVAKSVDVPTDILMVDDGSTDGTAELLGRRGDLHLLHHTTNAGYGQSLIDGFAYAADHAYDWAITMDCDEQHEPERIPDFIREIQTGQWDLISGSRYLRPSDADDLPPKDRRSINATITQILNDRLGLQLTDAFCGFKAHRVSAMANVHLTETGYAFPLQLWPAVVRAGLRITELPVRLIYNDLKRNFGGALNDAQVRLQHYLSVFEAEMAKPAFRPSVELVPVPVELPEPDGRAALAADADAMLCYFPCCCG